MSECECEECCEYCEDCSVATAPAELDRNEDKTDVRCCDDCAEKREESAECQCPGGEELGPCHCPACTGVR